MDIPGGVARAASVPVPHVNKVAERVRTFTSHWIKFKPRTRAIFVFVGASAVIVGWLTPWYISTVWVTTGGPMSAALRSGYIVTNSGNFGGHLLAQGLTPMIREFNGTALTSGPPALTSIAFTRHDFECWIGLAVLAVLAMWTYERPDLAVAHMVRKRIHLVLESGKVILLAYIAFRSIWKGVDLGTLATVNRHALSTLTSDFAAVGVPVSAAHDFRTTFSIGLVFVVLGLFFAALGILSGDKALTRGPGGGYLRVRMKAVNVAFIAVIVILVLYAALEG